MQILIDLSKLSLDEKKRKILNHLKRINVYNKICNLDYDKIIDKIGDRIVYISESPIIEYKVNDQIKVVSTVTLRLTDIEDFSNVLNRVEYEYKHIVLYNICESYDWKAIDFRFAMIDDLPSIRKMIRDKKINNIFD